MSKTLGIYFMGFSTSELIKRFDDLITDTIGQESQFESIDSATDFSAQSLVFVQNADEFVKHDTPPAVIVTDADNAQNLAPNFSGLIIVVNNVRLAQAHIKQAYQDYDARDEEWPEHHPSAVIHPTATIGEHCRIGANVVIGANVIIGDHCLIRANTVVEHDALLGKGCIINSLVNIGYGCQLGERVIVQSGVIIGNEGYGFAQDNQQHSHRIPHTGTVIIHDDVQIGANSNIHRGTYGATIIGKGSKLDAMVHIAHNVVVGEHCLITAQCVIAGSSHIGNRVIMSGQTGVLDHKNVADDAVLVHRCGVSEDIPSAGVWAGTPAMPLRDYVQSLRLGKKIKALQKQLRDLSS